MDLAGECSGLFCVFQQSALLAPKYVASAWPSIMLMGGILQNSGGEA